MIDVTRLERHWYWRPPLTIEYCLTPKAASCTIREWMRPVKVRSGNHRLPRLDAFTVIRDPCERFVSAVGQVARRGHLQGLTISTALDRLEHHATPSVLDPMDIDTPDGAVGRWLDIHLVPQAWWSRPWANSPDFDIIPMVGNWWEEVSQRLDIPCCHKVRKNERDTRRPALTAAQRARVEKLYACDMELWETLT